ncbi:MAG TPA: DUF2752 domain-containing protein [Verrucomicrobiae bacterium]|nr:DUF2752 domain-containing protein [Verrucomicrobiae bacterium]
MSPRAVRVAAVAGVFAVLYLITPPDLPLCGFRWLTGRPCPLCGLTHALAALSRGQFAEAMRLHALSPLAAAMLVGMAWGHPRLARLWAPCAAAFAVYGAVRMLAV